MSDQYSDWTQPVGQGIDQYDSYDMYGYRTIDNYMPRDTSDCVYITGLPSTVTKSQISDFFCRAGTILVTKSVQRIFIFMKDKTPTGAATVTYENPDSAKRAIDFFDEKDFKGEGKVRVRYASPDEKQPFANKLLRDAQKKGGMAPPPPHYGSSGGRRRGGHNHPRGDGRRPPRNSNYGDRDNNYGGKYREERGSRHAPY
ncbi:Oidioi.mRNA.OKI2018_I69.chr1.g202.t1.cds [Oikopleura dioica]|uniref:Oidioi.mRNA.OKI2018_I69.chr1.g202.t1.cds n=1 Tax=Oikopleura dioica TaxID=34765 RepID=A0ABN7SJ53_OIKDI|nr:Oidioi.mRNA.OKI2018_I69.chr1.g202.t1.cds [Oikopleura dioica]